MQGPLMRRGTGRRLCALVLGALCLASTAGKAAEPPPGLSPAEREVFRRIKARIIREATKTLADDRFEGRGTLQPGGDKAEEHAKSLDLALADVLEQAQPAFVPSAFIFNPQERVGLSS